MIRFLVFSLIALLYSQYAFSSEALRIEIHCSDSFKTVKKQELCSKANNCRWKVLKKSKTAASWQRGDNELVVTEVPNQSFVRVLYHSGPQSISLPWCSVDDKLSWSKLNKDDLSTVKKDKGTLYLIGPKSQATWNMLHAIDHPCRKLVKVEAGASLFWLYLKPSQKKACQK